MSRRVAIIGAGLGGLSAAITLAHKGLEVSVFELGKAPGGKMQETRFAGCRFDTGPSLLTMPFVLERIFADAGERASDYLSIRPIDPICRYDFANGKTLRAWGDITRFQHEIATISPEDARALPAYLDYSRRIYELTAELFIFKPMCEIKTLFQKDALRTLLHLHDLDLCRTVHQGNARFFSSPEMQQLFDRYATYSGSHPYRAPATLNVIPHVEYTLGSFMVDGGMYRVAEALYTLGSKLGVRYFFEMPVSSIGTKGNRVTGVQINGTAERFDAVVANSDVVSTFTTLLGRNDNWRQKLEPSCSGLVFLWAVEGNSELEHHNIFFSRDYRSEFDEIFSGKVPSDPTVYLALTSKSDPNDAPSGWENVFCLINMPALSPSGELAIDLDHIRSTILERLRRAGVTLRIRDERVISPKDFERATWTNRGSIYGVSSNSRCTTFLRQPNRARGIRNLYFCGGSAHPGGGIPLVLSSGRMAAEALLRDLSL